MDPLAGCVDPHNPFEPQPKRRKIRPKTFQWDWLKIPEFKPWLRPVANDDTKFFCSACNNSYNGGKSEINKHFKTRMHIEKSAKPICVVVQSQSLSTRPEESTEDTTDINNEEINNLTISNIEITNTEAAEAISLFKELNFHSKVQNAEIRLAAFFAEHNLSIQIAQFLLTLMKSILPDSEILKKMTLGRNKCTKIMTNVLGRCEKEKIIDNIRVDKFSIFVNESTDASNNKWLTFLVKYIDAETSQTRCELLELIKVKNKEAPDETLLSSFEDILQQKLIPSENLIGFASSNCAHLMDRIGLLIRKLRDTNPNLFIMDCVVNSANIAATNAMSKLTHNCEDIITQISAYLKVCGKKMSVFHEFQQAVENHYKKGVKGHKWFLFYDCITKLLSCWDALDGFLVGEMTTPSKNNSGEGLLELLRVTEVKATFLFLKHQLGFFKHFNDVFQKKTTVTHRIHNEISVLLKKIASHFLKPYVISHLSEINDVDYESPMNQVELDQVQLGTECTTFLGRSINFGDFNEARMMAFKKNCLEFFVAACEEITNKLPTADPVLSRLYLFDQTFALNDSERSASFVDLLYLAKEFNVCEDEEKLKTEWNILYQSLDAERKANLMKMDFDSMWIEVGNLREKTSGELLFPQLKKLVNIVRILPHSTVEAEGNFAVMANAKSKKRNLMDGCTLNAICMIKSSLKARGETSTTMNIDSRHFELMNSDNLYGQKPTKKEKAQGK